jgi:hypothetical protein
MVRFMIFGAGLSGQGALDLIGPERTYCFIDNYKAGETFCGKQIISYQEAKNINSEDYIIIVASANYKKEICSQLVADEIVNYFVYHENDVWRLRSLLPKYFFVDRPK